MQIVGLQKTTLLDYPGKVAATIFVGGCNFCCPFCHNGDLVKGIYREILSEEDVLNFLKKRKGILEGVCITGGEPTLQPDLEEFIIKVKELDYPVKLDTNGYRPDILKKLVENKRIDYVAMDIKSSPDGYNVAGGREIDIDVIKESVKYLLSDVIDYEFRTTLVEELHSIDTIKEIGVWIEGASKYYLQMYEESDNVMVHGFHPMTKEKMEEAAEILRGRIKEVGIRC